MKRIVMSKFYENPQRYINKIEQGEYDDVIFILWTSKSIRMFLRSELEVIRGLSAFIGKSRVSTGISDRAFRHGDSHIYCTIRLRVRGGDDGIIPQGSKIYPESEISKQGIEVTCRGHCHVADVGFACKLYYIKLGGSPEKVAVYCKCNGNL